MAFFDSLFDRTFAQMSAAAVNVINTELVTFSGGPYAAPVTVAANWVQTERSEKPTLHGPQVSFVAKVVVAGALLPAQPRQGVTVKREITGEFYRIVGKVMFIESDGTFQITLDSMNK